MSVLTDAFLREQSRAAHPDQIPDETALAYVRALLDPLERELLQMNDIPEMTVWVERTLPSNLAKHANPILMQEVQAGNGQKHAFISEFLRYIAREILEAAGHEAINSSSRQILPWDVRTAIYRDSDLNQIFPGNEYTLPVQVKISGQIFNHEMSHDLAAGILDFIEVLEQSNTQVPPVEITIFGGDLSQHFNQYFLDEDGFDIEENRGANGEYVMYLAGRGQLRFNSLEYLQGMSTAAQWMGADIHDWVSELGQYDRQTGQTTALTF